MRLKPGTRNPFFQWDPFQGANIWYFLQKKNKKNGMKVLSCFVKFNLITNSVHYKSIIVV